MSTETDCQGGCCDGIPECKEDSIPIAGIPLTLQLFTAGLAWYQAYEAYSAYDKYSDRASGMADRMVTMGQEYCERAKDQQDEEEDLFKYIDDEFPEYDKKPYAGRSGIAQALMTTAEAHKAAMLNFPASNVGAACDVSRRMAEMNIRNAVNRCTDGIIYEENLYDVYLETKLSTRTNSFNYSAAPSMGVYEALGNSWVGKSKMYLAEAGGAFTAAARLTSAMFQPRYGLTLKKSASPVSSPVIPAIGSSVVPSPKTGLGSPKGGDYYNVFGSEAERQQTIALAKSQGVAEGSAEMLSYINGGIANSDDLEPY